MMGTLSENIRAMAESFGLGQIVSVELKGDPQSFRFYAIVSTISTQFILKRVSPESTLQLMNIGSAEGLLRELSELNYPTLIPPLLSSSGQCIRQFDDARFLMFPYVSETVSIDRSSISVDTLIDITNGVYRDLSHLSVTAMHHLSLINRSAELLNIDNGFIVNNDIVNGVSHLHLDSFLPEYQRILAYKDLMRGAMFGAISHGDINLSNIVDFSGDTYRVIDIDNFRLGTPYFDRFFSMILFGADTDEFKRSIGRPIFDAYGQTVNHSESDLVVTALYAIGWYGFVRESCLRHLEHNTAHLLDALTHFNKGMRGFLEFYKEHGL